MEMRTSRKSIMRTRDDSINERKRIDDSRNSNNALPISIYIGQAPHQLLEKRQEAEFYREDSGPGQDQVYPIESCKKVDLDQ